MLRFNEKEGVEEKEKLKRYDLTLLRKSKLNPRVKSVVCMCLHLPFDDDCWRKEGKREDQKRSNC